MRVQPRRVQQRGQVAGHRVVCGCDADVPVETSSAAREQTAQLATRAEQTSVALLFTAVGDQQEDFCRKRVKGAVDDVVHNSIKLPTCRVARVCLLLNSEWFVGPLYFPLNLFFWSSALLHGQLLLTITVHKSCV